MEVHKFEKEELVMHVLTLEKLLILDKYTVQDGLKYTVRTHDYNEVNVFEFELEKLEEKKEKESVD